MNSNQARVRSTARLKPENREPIFKTMSENSRKGKWNVFEYTEDKKTVGSSPEDTKRFKSHVRIVKMIVSIITFLIILVSSVLSKISLLFMTSHVELNQKVPFCDINRPEQDFISTIPKIQSIAWIWAIIFAFTVPELGILFRSWRFCFFKKVKKPTWFEFLVVFITETCHVVGLAMLMIMILPKLNVIQGVMLTNCLCFIPAVLNIFSDFLEKSTEENENDRFFGNKLSLFFNILAAIAQIIGFVLWPWVIDQRELWFTPLALVLVSFHWWENFVSAKSRFTPIVLLNNLKISLSGKRYSTYLYISIWKIIAFSISAMLFSGIDFTQFFTDFLTGWEIHKLNVTETQINNLNYKEFSNLAKIVFNTQEESVYSATAAICWTLFIQVVASYICYVFTKFACKIKIQTFGFGISINFTVPTTIIVLCLLFTFRNNDVCVFHNILPDYLFFNTPPVGTNIYEDWYMFMPILWSLSQAWITRHIWTPKSNKNASTDSLFVTPLYNGLVIDQSLAMNRRRHSLSDIQQNNSVINEANTVTLIQPEDTVPKLYVCGTMWHEEKDEIISFLKSIMRLDEDYSARYLAKKHLNVDPIECEFYELETHIFVDDAFGHDPKEKISERSEEINKYVRTLITSIADASLDVYKTKLKYKNPIRYPTPYGGRLEWKLPGGSKLIAHLKNSKKIRAKKRWSQVMYMYYLLGHRLMQQSDLDDNRKAVTSENTFILALDGDIDFQPEAVHLLMNRMKVDENLGAACGRIHPIGNGPMVWYQKFEYAIGHWLQKATEHVIGCVLCSPGCFSLFRGSALMDGGILKRYTTVSEDASNFVQYDQGEDRWLCTLLLKEKYRVEYTAAADAYTHCPAGFYEFYNQRRRWVPSTMANIIDLLRHARPIVEKNDSISMLYIIYQMVILVGTILGPGTIFLMMIGALVAVFSIDIWSAFLWNFIPIVIFMLICYKFKKYQLPTALILTAVYSMVMMAVLIGVIIQYIEDGTASPSSIFFIVVAGEIIIAGLLHPREIGCLICGVIYYITIPSMYMLLIIYSLFNMNDVSWGTRETPKPDTSEKTETAGNTAEQKNGETGSIDISLFGLFRCMLCPQPKPPENSEQLNVIMKELMEIKTQMDKPEIKPNMIPPEQENPEQTVPIHEGQDPDWLTNSLIRYGRFGRLETEEREFWNELIYEYLKPQQLPKSELKKYQLEVQEKLDNLRDKCVATFIMLNALFVVVVYLLQLNRDNLHFVWPFGAKNYIVFDDRTIEIQIVRDYLLVEPIGLLFVLFFGIILFIQFLAMLVHRFGTLSQILAEVNDDWCKINIKLKTSLGDTEVVKQVHKLQKPKAMADIDETILGTSVVGKRRNTIKHINEIQKNMKIVQNTLRKIFFENKKTPELFKKLGIPFPPDDQQNVQRDSFDSENEEIIHHLIDTITQPFKPILFDRLTNKEAVNVPLRPKLDIQNERRAIRNSVHFENDFQNDEEPNENTSNDVQPDMVTLINDNNSIPTNKPNGHRNKAYDSSWDEIVSYNPPKDSTV